MEEAFFRKAKQAGLSDEKARSAYNSNMMSTGLLSERPAEFAQEHGRRWLASAYEAGDVVLHKPHAVRNDFGHKNLRGTNFSLGRFTHLLSTMTPAMLSAWQRTFGSATPRSHMIR